MCLERRSLGSEISQLRKEVDALRARCQRQPQWHGRWLVFAGGIVAGIFLGQSLLTSAYAVPQGEAKELVCSSLKVVGPGGKAMVVMGFDEDGGVVGINGIEGNQRVLMAVAPGRGPGFLGVYTPDNKKPMLVLDADSDGGSVHVMGSDNSPRVYLGVAAKVGGGLLTLSDPNKKARVVLEGSPNGGVIEKQ
jgi:hypothetical protein